jgi:lysophospholipase L1-like esterase
VAAVPRRNHTGNAPGRHPTRAGGLIVALCILAGARCGHSPSGPTPPVPQTLSIACPADFTAEVGAVPAMVTYSAPVVSGGTAPVSTTCTPPANGSFPAGVTDVACVAVDQLQHRAQCVFHVTVRLAPKLAGTRFLAFGDSITAGENGMQSPPGSGVFFIDPVNNYPTLLAARLRDRYIGQASSIVVTNDGRPLETAVGGQERLVDALVAYQPDVLLLLEGVNDVNTGGEISAEDTADALAADITQAYRRGAQLVILSTLLPESTDACQSGVPCRALNPDGIPDVNERIRSVAESYHAVLVDAYAAFQPSPEALLGPDGLHPNAEGSKVLADLFFDAIMANFETTPTIGLTRAGAQISPSIAGETYADSAHRTRRQLR